MRSVIAESGNLAALTFIKSSPFVDIDPGVLGLSPAVLAAGSGGPVIAVW